MSELYPGQYKFTEDEMEGGKFSYEDESWQNWLYCPKCNQRRITLGHDILLSSYNIWCDGCGEDWGGGKTYSWSKWSWIAPLYHRMYERTLALEPDNQMLIKHNEKILADERILDGLVQLLENRGHQAETS